MLTVFRATIARKLPLMFVALSLGAATVTAYISYTDARDEMVSVAEDRLQTALSIKSGILSEWLEGIDRDLTLRVGDPGLHAAFKAFDEAYDAIPGDPVQTLQKAYITDNPHPLGEKDKLVTARDGSAYSDVHAQYHPYYRDVLLDSGYYDIFFFNPEGDLIYTVFKELDYATNLNTGQWRDTDLGRAFRAADAAKSSPKTTFFDFKPYAPSAGAPASFMSRPVISKSGEYLGVLAFQMPIDRLNGVMSRDVGLGTTGVTYIVGDDALMRSDLETSVESDILSTVVDTPVVRSALGGGSGVAFDEMREGGAVYTSYAPLDFLGTTWALVAEQDKQEVLAGVTELWENLVKQMLISMIVIAGLGILIARRIANPITGVGRAMNRVREGDMTTEIPFTARHDEVGDMARSLEHFRSDLQQANEQRAFHEKAQAQAQETQNHVVRELTTGLSQLAAGNFQARIRSDFPEGYEKLRNDFNEAMEKMQDVLHSVIANANSIENSAQEMSQSTENLATRTERSAASLEQTAAALEELTASVKSTAEGADQANDYVANTKQKTEKSGEVVDVTVKAMHRIRESSEQISKIITVIDEIAFQTNLLALNAGVEAARAGSAGRGFAVVASEVRALAQRSSDAAQEINDLITESSEHVKSGVDLVEQTGTSLSEIMAMVGDINGLVSTIATASKEQSTAITEVNSAIAQLDSATQQNAAMVQESTAASVELSREARELNTLMSQFSIGDWRMAS